MKNKTVILLSLIVMSGCIKTSEETTLLGVSEQKVINVLGIPDFISERNGDQMRIYKGNGSPAYKWPDYAIKEYYYINIDKEYVFSNNRLLEVGDISADRKETLSIIGDRGR